MLVATVMCRSPCCECTSSTGHSASLKCGQIPWMRQLIRLMMLVAYDSTQPSFRQGAMAWVTIASQQCAHAGGVNLKRIMGFMEVGGLPSGEEFIMTSNHCARSEIRSGS